MWDVDRFCYLMRAVRSVDQHLNSNYGPFPIINLDANDYVLDPKASDAAFDKEDRALIHR